MRRLVYLSDARALLRNIATYIATESGDRDVARAFVATLRKRCERLASLPGALGTLRPELAANLRSTSHGGYLIFFRYAPDAVEIVAIVRAERDLEAVFQDTISDT